MEAGHKVMEWEGDILLSTQSMGREEKGRCEFS